MSRWLKLDMDVASAVTLADAQCMEAAKMSRAEREHLVSVVSAPSMFVMPKISGTHCRCVIDHILFVLQDLSLSSGCLEVYKELISISLMDSDFLLPSIKVPGWKASDCASSHGMNLGSCGEELCMLTERAIEEPNLRRSAEMNHCASFSTEQ
ncbi:hypothetical protein Bca52824_048472 [Brassica carinata]|uniref:VAN3-binding protein-like auxin canalisation domain-containing protein n=1 Tax=Brassica carinata TaxID=52824 RepID=A0A8X7RJ35_BRACI|nr:hypothetical protein Bca52824_048472 [Brassica carinata]